MSILKGCPLCGGEASVTDLVSSINISCGIKDNDSDSCGLVLFGSGKETKTKMIKKWNTRHKDGDV